MGGGKVNELKITEKERTDFIEKLKNETIQDNNYVTVKELAEISNRGSTQSLCARIKKLGYKMTKRFINGRHCYTVSLEDAQKIIKETTI